MKRKITIHIIQIILLISGALKAQVINNFAGTPTGGFSGDGGFATSAQFNTPNDVAIDASGNVFIADAMNHRIRKVNPAGIVTTIAGTGVPGFSGDGGLATAAQLNTPYAVDIDATGNIYISDFSNNRIRKINAAGIITTIAGTGVSAFGGDGGAATSAQISNPHGVTFDGTGNMFIVDVSNQRIRKVNLSGIISTFVGTGAATYGGDGGPAINAQISNPTGITFDIAGNLFIADYNNKRIRKVNTGGIISTFAGTGVAGFSGDGGLATSAQLNLPANVGFDPSGNLYITDHANCRIRKVNVSGIISTIAGTGAIGSTGDGGPAISALLNYPVGICVDASGTIYFADRNNQRIRKINCTIPAAPINTTPLANQNICVFNTSTLVASSPGTINWFASPSSTTILSTGTNYLTPTLSVGTYTYYAEAQTCATSATRTAITITVNALPVVSVNSGSICTGNSFTIIPSGANTYTFQGGNAVVTPTTNASYTVIGTSSVGCLSSPAAISNITVNALPTITANNGTICLGNSFTINPNGGVSYTFSAGSAIVTPTANITYTITGASPTGCENFAFSSVTVNTLPILNASSTASILCSGQTAGIAANGANTYTWNTGATTSIILISPSITTNYTVSGTGANGCITDLIITQSVTICSGTKQLSQSEVDRGISLYPNPFQTKITFASKGTNQSILIYNSIGLLIYNSILENEKVDIDLSAQAKGIYIIEVKENSNTIYRSKIIKD